MRNIGRKDWQIIDRPRFMALLQEEFGNARGFRLRAARGLGLTRDQITRLLDGTRKAVTAKTVQKLVRGLPSRRADLEEIFFTPSARQRLQTYAEWLEQGRLAIRDLSGRGGRDDPPVPQDVMNAIEGLRVYRGYFRTFRKRLLHVLNEEGLSRVLLAELEAVAPLARAGTVAGIERTAWELHEARELGSYLEAALRMQYLLLKRSSADHRARAGGPIPSRSNPLGKSSSQGG